MTLIGLIGTDFFICDHLFDLCYLCCVFFIPLQFNFVSISFASSPILENANLLK